MVNFRPWFKPLLCVHPLILYHFTTSSSLCLSVCLALSLSLSVSLSPKKKKALKCLNLYYIMHGGPKTRISRTTIWVSTILRMKDQDKARDMDSIEISHGHMDQWLEWFWFDVQQEPSKYKQTNNNKTTKINSWNRKSSPIYGQGFDQACHPFFLVSQD